MDNINRQKDLNKVFDERWHANRVDNDKIRQARKDFNFKMYGIRDKEDVRKELRESNTVNAKVERLNQKMEGIKNLNRNNFR